MPLAPCTDLSAADWITTSDRPWDQLIEFGPAGFPAYARLRFIPDPAYAGQSENDVEIDEGAPSETDQLRMALEVLARRTTTPDDCYFCLWEGWGLEGIGAPASRRSLVVVPHRAYLLFHGSVTDLGERGSATRWPGQPKLGWSDPAFIWPADHAWCVANDVDPHWAGIGAPASAIEQLIADPRLDVALADPQTDQPRFR
jgi:hypothetical protein